MAGKGVTVSGTLGKLAVGAVLVLAAVVAVLLRR